MVVSRAATFILGIATGALSVLMYQRYRQVVEEESSEVLVEKITKNLQTLEERTSSKD